VRRPSVVTPRWPSLPSRSFSTCIGISVKASRPGSRSRSRAVPRLRPRSKAPRSGDGWQTSSRRSPGSPRGGDRPVRRLVARQWSSCDGRHTPPKVGMRPIRGVPYWIDSACRRAV